MTRRSFFSLLLGPVVAGVLGLLPRLLRRKEPVRIEYVTVRQGREWFVAVNERPTPYTFTQDHPELVNVAEWNADFDRLYEDVNRKGDPT